MPGSNNNQVINSSISSLKKIEEINENGETKRIVISGAKKPAPPRVDPMDQWISEDELKDQINTIQQSIIKEQIEELNDDEATNDNQYDEFKNDNVLEFVSRAAAKRQDEKIKKVTLKTLEESLTTNQRRFYHRLVNRFDAFFLACSAAASEFIVADNKMNLSGKFGFTLKLLAPLCNILPVIGPLLTTALNATGSVVMTADEQRQTQRLKNIARALQRVENKKFISAEIAMALTERYQEQLFLLPINKQSVNLIIKGIDTLAIHSENEQYLAHRLAEKIFHHIIEVVVQNDFIKNKTDHTNESFVNEFLKAYDQPYSITEETTEIIEGVGRRYTIKSKFGTIWFYDEILEKPAIQTPDLTTYESKHTDNRYGRQYASKETAESLGFTLQRQARYIAQPPTQRLREEIQKHINEHFKTQNCHSPQAGGMHAASISLRFFPALTASTQTSHQTILPASNSSSTSTEINLSSSSNSTFESEEVNTSFSPVSISTSEENIRLTSTVSTSALTETNLSSSSASIPAPADMELRLFKAERMIEQLVSSQDASLKIQGEQSSMIEEQKKTIEEQRKQLEEQSQRLARMEQMMEQLISNQVDTRVGFKKV